jgi:hypothetical protein
MFKRGESTNAIQKARIRKTKYFYEDRDLFMTDLASDIIKGIKLAAKLGLKPVFRLIGNSDLSWEKYDTGLGDAGEFLNIFQAFPTVQFYDYTKVLGRKADYPNYFLIFSQADGNEADVNKAIAQGMNVATVFDEVPAEYKGRPVINADETDLRFLDPKGVIAGLKAKGKAKKDYSGFVIRLKEAA